MKTYGSEGSSVIHASVQQLFSFSIIFKFIYPWMLELEIWLTFPCPPVHSMLLLLGSGSAGASAVPAVCFSFLCTRTTAAWPPQTPPAQMPQMMLYFSGHQYPHVRQNYCCYYQLRPQVPHSTLSSQCRGQQAPLQEHIVHTGIQSFRCFHCCCCCCYCCCCLWLLCQWGHPHWNASRQSANFCHTSSRDIKNCREKGRWSQTKQNQNLNVEILKFLTTFFSELTVQIRYINNNNNN